MQISNDFLGNVQNVIYRSYGDVISFGEKGKYLRKFGRNTNLSSNTEAQVWQSGGIEVLSTTNDITHFASDDAGDTQTITVEGHTIDGSDNLTFSIQNLTLAGQTKTALTTPLARVTRLYNTGSTDFAGTVSVSKDVAYTNGVPASDVHLTVAGADNQSLKAATSISQNDYWVITSGYFAVKRSATAIVDFKVQVKLKGQVWRTQLTATVSNSSGGTIVPLDTPIIIPPNSDVRVLATSTANSTQVDAYVDGILAIIEPATSLID